MQVNLPFESYRILTSTTCWPVLTRSDPLMLAFSAQSRNAMFAIAFICAVE